MSSSSLFFSRRALIQVSMTTQSDESAESLALYTLVQLRCHVTGNEKGIGGTPYIRVQALRVRGLYMGAPTERKKMKKQ